MLWALVAIFAAFCNAVVYIIDKFILSKYVKNPIVPVMISSVLALVSGISVYLLFGFSEMSYFNIFLTFVAALGYVSMLVFYFRAMKIEDASTVSALFYIAPLFTAVLAFFFLAESFTPIKYAGIVLIVAGALLISLRKFKLSNALWLMIPAILSVSVTTIIIKYLTGFADFLTIFAYLRIWSFVIMIPVLFHSFRSLVKTVKLHGLKPVAMMTFSESLTLFVTFLMTFAFSIGQVTLVNALSSVQPFFVLLFMVVLSAFFPKILKEDIGRSTVILKLVAIALMFVGAMLIM